MLQTGDLVAERFSIESLAGQGGMGIVYRALDRQTNKTVALKLLTATQGPQVDRFSLESYTLSTLTHPGIVRYISHGTTASGAHYMAMEWLEGEDLSSRLKRGRLSLDEGLSVLTQLAEALSEVHQKGLIHRDIKPSNVFLCDKDLSRVKLLDFGIARIGPADGLTRTGAIMGTPGYLAPEQSVRGAKGLDASADIFALGCVLFECLTGRPTFSGGNVLAVLSKILLEDAPRLSEHREDIPGALDALVVEMLSKTPSTRPRDASALLARLKEPSLREATQRPTAGSSMQDELHLFAVVLADLGGATTVAAESTSSAHSLVGQAHSQVELLGGRLTPLVNGALLLSFSEAESPADLAVRAARAALALRSMSPNAPLSLALGYGEAQRFVGEVIERAAAMVREASFSVGSPAIRIDEVAARFLSARFEIAEGSLLKEKPTDGLRTLLGRPTACVGRERELLLLEAAYQSCIEDNTARGILLTAPPGVGKSRLLSEFLQRRADAAPLLLVGHGDPMRAGSAYGLIGQALRELCGVIDGEPAEGQRQRLAERLGARVQDPSRVTMFLGEMLGVPSVDEQDPQLKAARQDALLMSDQIQRAFEDWLRAECAAQPVLLIFEDLHWGDPPSLRLAEMALRAEELPLMVVATARPTIHESSTLNTTRFEEVKLSTLSKRASERLIREVLREKATPEMTQLLIERSSGNAFYLEEMLRAVSEGKTELPGTVLAMASARLEVLPQEARRTLRAASIFGERVWRGGLVAILGQSEALEHQLRQLCEKEVLGRRASAKFSGEEEYHFRHALLRDAAYTMLTDEDKRAGHRLAALWLEGIGEHDALTLAEHFERGGVRDRAAFYYKKAAEQAFEGNDLDGVFRCVKRGLSCDAIGETRGMLLLLDAEARNWRAEFEAAEQAATEALSLLPLSEPHFRALGEAIVASGRRGDIPKMKALAERMLELPVVSPPSLAQASCLSRSIPRIFRSGLLPMGFEAVRRLESIAKVVSPQDGKIWIWCKTAALLSAMLSTNYEAWCGLIEELSAAHATLGDVRSSLSTSADLGFAYVNAGALDLAEQRSRETLEGAQRYQLDRLLLVCASNLCLILSLQGRLDEAETQAKSVLSLELVQKDAQILVMLRCKLAGVYLAKNDLTAAEEQITLAQPYYQAEFHSAFMANVLSKLRRAQGRYQEALAAVRPNVSFTGVTNGLIVEWDIARTFVELLLLEGERAEAKEALAKFKARINKIAAQFKTPSWRERFLAKPNIAALCALEID